MKGWTSYGDGMRERDIQWASRDLRPGDKVTLAPHLNSGDWYHHSRYGQTGTVVRDGAHWTAVDFGSGPEDLPKRYLAVAL